MSFSEGLFCTMQKRPIMVGGAIARRHSRTGHETFTSSGSSAKQAHVMSTLSGGLHHGSDREARPGWRAYCRCGCRPGGELRGGLLT